MKFIVHVLSGSLALALLGGAGAARADGIEAAGDVLQYVLPLTAEGLTIIHEDWDGSWRYAGAFALQGVTVLALKNTVYETRPNGVGHQSFPSGHTAAAFSAAEFMRARYGWAYGAPAYALAAFTGYSRVESDHHYWHDVGAGAGIGILSSWLFTRHGKIWDVSPSTDGKSFGLTFKRFW